MRVVFATFGSLGDLHPYIAIARKLVARGHQAVIATFDAYRETVESAEVEFAVMRPLTAVLGDQTAIIKLLFDPHKGPEYLVREMFMPHIRESFEDLARAAEGAHLLVSHPLAYAAPLLAEKRKLRWVSTVLAPLSLFSAIDPPHFAAAPWLDHVRRLGVWPYRQVFRLARLLMRKWELPLVALRTELGLTTPGPLAQMEGQYSPALNLALFSPLLAAPQADWPRNTQVCGFPRYDGPPPDAAAQNALDAFLAAGEPPIVFALGSSVVAIANDFWSHAIHAARSLGRRAILLTGKTSAQPSSLPPGIAAFEYLPYSLVFPHAAAVVHQAGIGTLAQALASAHPQLIVPVAFDQPDNARRAAALQVARTLPFAKVTATTMARELKILLETPVYAQQAAVAGKSVQAEDGAATASELLSKFAA